MIVRCRIGFASPAMGVFLSFALVGTSHADDTAQPGPMTPAAPAPSAFPASAGSSLQGTEGVHVQTMCTNCNSANIDLGGLGGDLLPIDFDGYDVVGGLQAIYLLGVTPPALIGGISVDKGPGDFAAPGEAMGGAIHVRSTARQARPPADVSGEGGSFDWVAGQANGTFRRGGLSMTGLYLRAHSGAIDANGDGVNESGRLSRRYEAAEAAYRFSSGWTVSAGGAAIHEDSADGHGRFSWVDSFLTGRAVYFREDAFVDADQTRFGLDGPVGNNGTLTLRAVRSVRNQDTFDPTFDPEQLEPSYSVEDRNFSAELRYEHIVTDRVLLSGGITRRRQVLDVENFQSVFLALRFATDVFDNAGIDAGANLDFSPRWHLRAGARYDMWETSHATGDAQNNPDSTQKITRSKRWRRVSPRARLMWNPVAAWTFAASAGGGSRAARPIFEELCCGQQYQSNVELDLERAIGASLEAVWQPEPRFRVGAFLDRTAFRDHIVRIVGTSFLAAQTYVQGNVPRARYTSLTINSKVLLPERFAFDLAWSWLEAVNVSGKPVAVFLYPPSSGLLTRHNIPMGRIPYRPIRTGSISLRWTTPGARWEIGTQAQYQGPMPIQRWYSGFDTAKYDRPPVQYGLRYNAVTTLPIWVVNARASLRAASHLAIHFGVDNIGDRVQTDLLDPSNDYNWGPIRGRMAYGGLSVTL